MFIERFELPDEAPAASEASETESIVIRLEGRKHTRRVRARRHHSRSRPPRGPQAAVRLPGGKLRDLHGLSGEGKVTMRVNNALDAGEVEEGWVLTCQAIPTSREVVVDYDR